MRSVELFAGAGGMALGLHRAGIHAAALVEYSPAACLTLAAAVADGRLSGDVICDDAHTVDLAPFAGVDLVCGGPPCQPFSSAGKGGGESDERDGWPAFLRAVRVLRPRFVLAENVRGFLFDKFTPYRLRIQRELEGMGYRLRVGLLNSADFGVPQTRERVFILGARQGERLPPWPAKTHHDPKRGPSLFSSSAPWVSAGEAVGIESITLIDGQTAPAAGGERVARERAGGLPAFTVRDIKGGGSHIFARVGAAIDPKHPPVRLDEPAGTIRSGGRGHSAPPTWVRLQTLGGNPSQRDMAGDGTRWGPSCPWKDGPADTVKGDGWSHQVRLLPDVARAIGASEAVTFRAPWQWRAAWQSFPADWPWQYTNQAQRDRQIGNAVPPPLAEALGRAIVGACGQTLTEP